jgi:hypothetical protein
MRTIFVLLGAIWSCMAIAAEPRTEDIVLSDPVIYQSKPLSDGYVSFTLRARWQNNASERAIVFYSVHFYDARRTELYRDKRFREIDARGATIAPQVVGTFRGKQTDDFDYRAVKSVVIRYQAKDDGREKSFESVPIRLEAE